MRAFLCSIDEAVWDAVDVRWTRLEAAKSTWDKAALVAANANSKTLAKEVWQMYLQMNFTEYLTFLL